jgi:hypothetical protein
MSATGVLTVAFLLAFVFAHVEWAGQVGTDLFGLTVGLLVVFALMQPTYWKRDSTPSCDETCD